MSHKIRIQCLSKDKGLSRNRWDSSLKLLALIRSLLLFKTGWMICIMSIIWILINNLAALKYLSMITTLLLPTIINFQTFSGGKALRNRTLFKSLQLLRTSLNRHIHFQGITLPRSSRGVKGGTWWKTYYQRRNMWKSGPVVSKTRKKKKMSKKRRVKVKS